MKNILLLALLSSIASTYGEDWPVRIIKRDKGNTSFYNSPLNKSGSAPLHSVLHATYQVFPTARGNSYMYINGKRQFKKDLGKKLSKHTMPYIVLSKNKRTVTTEKPGIVVVIENR